MWYNVDIMVILPLPLETVAERRVRKAVKRRKREGRIQSTVAAEERFAGYLNQQTAKINACSARIKARFRRK